LNKERQLNDELMAKNEKLETQLLQQSKNNENIVKKTISTQIIIKNLDTQNKELLVSGLTLISQSIHLWSTKFIVTFKCLNFATE
jgi:hypothetical protein